MTVATMPPMSIHTALSVGDPVKNLETSELNEFMALIPNIISTIPPTRKPMETILFMRVLFHDCDSGDVGWYFDLAYTRHRPVIKLTSTMTIATTNKTWMKPPIV